MLTTVKSVSVEMRLILLCTCTMRGSMGIWIAVGGRVLVVSCPSVVH